LFAYDGGTFADTSRDAAAIGFWWIAVLAVAAGLWPVARVSSAALAVGGLLAAFALLTLLSTVWADSAEGAFSEFNRASLYVAVFALVVLACTRWSLPRWSDGLALGIVATAGLALFTRCFPDVILTEETLRFLPLDFTRLSYPLEYWNGLAIFTALAVPLLLRLVIAGDRPLVGAIALLPFPVIGAVVYLTSSRGGVATAVVGVLALLALAPYTRTVEAVVIALIGSAAGVAFVATRSTLVNDPGPQAAGQGHIAFALVLGSCVLTAALGYLTLRYVSSSLERGASRLGPRVRLALAALAVVCLAGGIVAAHPVRLFEKFKRPPPSLAVALANTSKNPIPQHLLSSGSSGRWQQWASALDEFRSAPAVGRGAGSFEAWWAEHGTVSGHIENAHSLYLETLGELGIVGLVLLVAAFAAGLVTGVRRALASTGETRVTIAALSAGFAAYAFAAGVDWMWEMTVVSIVAFAMLGLLVSGSADGPEALRPLRRRWQVATRGGFAGVGLLAAAALGLSLLAERELQASNAAAARGDVAAALSRADSARKIEPWASRPYVQLALVSEQSGDYRAAEAWIQKAIARDRRNWQVWLLSARFEIGLGRYDAATADLRRARKLNPRSPLLARVEEASTPG